uniref:Oxysterol-binding protein n=1 Tax=Branchiostoma floridae TaxID=7739 RepID=C3YE84_BRAFL|eukprot:XP_002605382.1 hypothetical protein BRAFLDRAFT_74202 [Branchiostoma floridae]
MTMKRVCFRSQDEVILLPAAPSVDDSTGNHPRPPRKPLVTGERKYAFQNQKSRYGLPPPSTLAVEKQPHHMSTPNISSAKKVYVAETTPTSPTSQQRSEEMRLRQEFVNNAKEAPPVDGTSAQDGTARLSLKSTSDKSTSGSSKETPSPKKEKDSPDLEKGEWEIVEGLKTGTTVEKSTPSKYEGFMLKKRKWPLKGWHKRFFVLEKGFLKYAKRLQSVQRGKLHGSIDVGLSVMSIMKDARRIDLDTEDSIYHLKLKSHDLFNIWVSKLREHRLWRQNEIASGGSDSKYNSDVFSTPLSPETPPLIRNRRLSMPRTMSRSSSALGQGRVAAWLMESEAMEQCNKELSSVQTKVYQLNSILQEFTLVYVFVTELSSVQTKVYQLNSILQEFTLVYVFVTELSSVQTKVYQLNSILQEFTLVYVFVTELSSVQTKVYQLNSILQEFTLVYVFVPELSSVQTKVYQLNSILQEFTLVYVFVTELSSVQTKVYQLNSILQEFTLVYVFVTELSSVQTKVYQLNSILQEFTLVAVFCADQGLPVEQYSTGVKTYLKYVFVTELSSVQTKVYQLNSILQELQRLQSSLDDQYKYLDLSVPDLASKKKSWRLSFRKSKHKKSMSHGGSSTASTSSTASVSSNRNSTGAITGAMLPPPSTLAVEKQPHHMSTPNISSAKKVYVAETTPTSPTSQQRSEEMRLRQEFVNNAKEVYSQLKVLTLTLRSERDKLQDAMGQQVLSPAHGGHADRLGTVLAQVQAQNADMRARLNRIAREADLSTVQTPGGTLDQKTPLLQRQFSGDDHLSLSTADSVTEFFDAEEFLISSSSSDGPPILAQFRHTWPRPKLTQSHPADGPAILHTPVYSRTTCSVVIYESYLYEVHMGMDQETEYPQEDPGMSQTGHRAQLPCPKPETGDLSIWSIMRKNIGKDLSKVCMPVTMNEPLNTLQRLAEELEYSELLDKAAETDNPYERMALIAAFAVSGYSSTYYRAGQKPFNPLLGETYECVREDKGFSFIAEQVSHHPPISACHCKGEKWVFWQDARLKTKFWGKSMEIIPIGTVNVSIPKYNDHYTWSKVTSCIHNIMTGQRWMDHYGEKIIKNKDITCKLMFHKASYWSTRCHDVLGSVLDKDGKEIHHLFGKWHEGLWCGHAPSAKCIWRPGSMPEEYDLYYGFTRFAVELNELTPDLKTALPPTDTRFRPDQRLLEEGQVQRAQNEKVRLEQMQRMREREREEAGVVYQPRFFRLLEEGQVQRAQNEKVRLEQMQRMREREREEAGVVYQPRFFSFLVENVRARGHALKQSGPEAWHPNKRM